MSDFVFNVSKGRIVEYYNRVKNNDPATSAFVIVPVDVAAVTDATIKDFDDLAAILAGGVTERAATGWNRKALTDVELAALPAPDDTNDRYDVDIPDLTWPAVTAGTVTDLIICYDANVTAGSDSAVVPLTQHDFAIPAPDGSDIVAVIAAAGFFRAT